jgi:hypothetical protein
MEGRADEAEADARSVMAVNADVAPFGQPYLTARRMLVAALMHSGRHHEAVAELTGFIDAIPTDRRTSGLLLPSPPRSASTRCGGSAAAWP